MRDPTELDIRSRVSRRLPHESQVCSYVLQESGLLRSRFADPITTIADRHLGNMLLALCGDRFAMEAYVGGGGIDRYCFTLFLRGKASWLQGKSETITTGTVGTVQRLKPGTRILLSDNNARQNLLIKTETLEYALEAMLGDRLQTPLEFRPTIDWSRGLAASLRHQLDILMLDMARGDGIADNAVALASFRIWS